MARYGDEFVPMAVLYDNPRISLGDYTSLLNKINWHSIYLIDPEEGDEKRILISKFKRVWRDSEEKRWFAAVKKIK